MTVVVSEWSSSHWEGVELYVLILFWLDHMTLWFAWIDCCELIKLFRAKYTLLQAYHICIEAVQILLQPWFSLNVAILCVERVESCNSETAAVLY